MSFITNLTICKCTTNSNTRELADLLLVPTRTALNGRLIAYQEDYNPYTERNSTRCTVQAYNIPKIARVIAAIIAIALLPLTLVGIVLAAITRCDNHPATPLADAYWRPIL